MGTGTPELQGDTATEGKGYHRYPAEQNVRRSPSSNLSYFALPKRIH